jgi:hypothetical protein
MTEPPESPVHFTDAHLAAFLDRRLTPLEHRSALAHFAACPACRREMTAASRLVHAGRGRGTWLGPVVAVLAAAIAFAVVPRSTRDADGVSDGARTEVSTPQRSLQPDRMATVAVLSPTDGALVDASPIKFRWRSLGKDATYRLTFQDVTGEVLWDATTGDTTVTLPGRVTLTSGQHYFWSVDAQLVDGRSAKAVAHRFTVR